MVECIQCHDEKLPTEFYAHKEMAAGHVNVCKDCHKERMRVRRRLDPHVQEYERARAKTEKRRAKSSAYDKKWREKNPLAYKAHYLLSNAVRDGRVKKLPCEFCSRTDVHAHHRDYSRPFDVVWLCPKCHHRLHAMFPELEDVNKVSA